jgi:hypothetical protein
MHLIDLQAALEELLPEITEIVELYRREKEQGHLPPPPTEKVESQ